MNNDLLIAPLELVIEVTSACNLNCKYCYNGKKNNVDPTVSEIKRIIDEAKNLSIFQLCLSGGECFLREDIFDILEYTVEQEIDISIVTNGTLLNEDTIKKLADLGLIDFMQISLDSHLESIHNSVRGKYKETIIALEKILKYASNSPMIGSVIHKQNVDTFLDTIDYFYPAIKYFHIMNVQATDLALHNRDLLYVEPKILTDFWNKINEKAQLPDISIDVYQQDLRLKETARFTGCTAGKTKLVVTPDLSAIPCDITRNIILGSLKTNTIKEIWNSENMLKIRTSSLEPCYEINKKWYKDFV